MAINSLREVRVQKTAGEIQRDKKAVSTAVGNQGATGSAEPREKGESAKEMWFIICTHGGPEEENIDIE